MKKKKINSHCIAKLTMSEEEIMERKKEHLRIVESAKLIAKNNGKSIVELEEIIKSKFGGRLVIAEEFELRNIKMNIALNNDLNIPKMNEISEMEEFWEMRRKKAEIAIENDMSFDIVIYEFDIENQCGNNARLSMDRNHDYITLSNGNRELMNDILIEYGVFQKDIEEETPRFISYALALDAKKIVEDN